MGMLGFVGFLLPAVIDLINTHISNSNTRFWVSMIFCSAVGTVLYFVGTGGVLVSLDGLFDQILIIVGQAQLAYQAVWDKSSLRANLGLNAKVD